jgi:hypothetical protein
MTAIPLSFLATSRHWQNNFLAVLPAVQSHATITFRHLGPEAKAEAEAHAIATACVNYYSLTRKHKLSQAYAGSVATYAVKMVKGGRCVGGHLSSKDVLNPLTHRRRQFTVRSTSSWDRAEGQWRDMVLETRRASPADQACFNIDFQEWLQQWPERHRRIIHALASGERTNAVAKQFGVTEARISQLRRQYETSWEQFQNPPHAKAA